MYRMTTEHIDRIIAPLADPRDERPFLTDSQLASREARHPACRIPDNAVGLPAEALDYLECSRRAEIIASLRLHPVVRAVTLMRLGGYTVREIALITGLRKWRVERALRTVRRKLERRAGNDGYAAAGWQDVYLTETRRKGK